jgi:hypothetical protein
LIQIIIPESQEWYHLAGIISLFIAIILAIIITPRKDASAAAKTTSLALLEPFWLADLRSIIFGLFFVIVQHTGQAQSVL